MRQIRRYPFFIHLTLAACLIASLVGAKEVVLCFGDDGHVAIERITSNGSCGTPVTPSLPSIVYAGHCGPCIDFTLAANDASFARSQIIQNVVAQTNLLALSAPLFPLPRIPFTAAFQTTLVPQSVVSSVTQLRSVILLI